MFHYLLSYYPFHYFYFILFLNFSVLHSGEGAATEPESAGKRRRGEGGPGSGEEPLCHTHTDTRDFQAEEPPAGISVIVIAE